jgi:hypothetical protein
MSEKIEKLITNIRNEMDESDDWSERTIDFLSALKHLNLDIRSNIHVIIEALTKNKDHEAVKRFMDTAQDFIEKNKNNAEVSETDYFGYFQMMSCGYDERFEEEGKM